MVSLPSRAALHGPSDKQADQNAPQVMQIRLHDAVFQEILSAVKTGAPPQISFGPNPSLEINNRTIPLSFAPERFRNEVYKYSSSDKSSWEFCGIQSHTVTLSYPKKKVDPSLEALKNSLVLADLEKKAKSTLRVDGSRINSDPKKHINALEPTKPTLATSDSSEKEKQRKRIQAGIRYAMIHLLATKTSLPISEIRRKLRIPDEAADDFVLVPLRAVASQVISGQNKTWKLKDKSYRELNVWRFPYESQDVRQLAIDNSIRAYDRLRIATSDPVWQLLLPEAERNQGKILSRLNFSSAKEPEKSPSIRPAIDKNTGLPRTAKKKTTEKEAEQDKTKDDRPSSSLSKKGADEPKPAQSTLPKAKRTELEKPKAIVVTSPKASSKPMHGAPPTGSRADQRPGSAAAKTTKRLSNSPTQTPLQSPFLFKPSKVQSVAIKKKVPAGTSTARPGSSGAASTSLANQRAASKNGSASPSATRPKATAAINGRTITQTGAGVSKTQSRPASKSTKTLKPEAANDVARERTEKRPTTTSSRPAAPAPSRTLAAAAADTRASSSGIKRKSEAALTSPRQNKTRRTEQSTAPSARSARPAAPATSKTSGTKKSPVTMLSPQSSSSKSSPVENTRATSYSRGRPSSTRVDDRRSDSDIRSLLARRADEFKMQYEIYERFHKKLSAREPTEVEIQRLCDLRASVEKLKREIWDNTELLERRAAMSSRR